MYICLYCEKVFEEPGHYVEHHGDYEMPGEIFYGCPFCDGSYVEAIECDGCGEYIVGDYIETADGNVYCEECYMFKNIEDLI